MKLWNPAGMKLSDAHFIVFLTVFNEIEWFPVHCFPQGFQWNGTSEDDPYGGIVGSHFIVFLRVFNEMECPLPPRHGLGEQNRASPFHCFPQGFQWNGASGDDPCGGLNYPHFIVFLKDFNEMERYRFSQVGLPFHCFPKGFQWNWGSPVSLFS